MAFTGNSNGVGYVISPFFAVDIGPSGLPAQFQSGPGTGQSYPIIISFDRDVLNFVIEIVGPSFAGNLVIGYDVNGNIITQQESQFTAVGGVDQAYRVEVQTVASAPFREVHLIPATGDYVAYRNLYLYSLNSPYQAPPVTFTPGAGTSALDLSQFLQVSTNAVARQYVKNSLTPLSPDTIQLRNLSQDIDITVTSRGLSGVTFTPATVDIPRGTSVSVEIDYDVTQLNNLPDGTNVINAVFDISSDTPVSSPIPIPTPTPTPTPTSTIPTNAWLEERFAGAPAGPLDQTPIATIFARPPISTTTVTSINYGNGTMVAPISVRWQGNWNFQNGDYKFSATIDDGMRVWLDGNLVLDQWALNPSRTYSFTQNMSAGLHNIRIEYFNGYTDCAAIFGFSINGSPTVYNPPVVVGSGGGGNSNPNTDSGEPWQFTKDGNFTQYVT